MNYTTWRRQLAVSESMALRGLVRMHGYLPTFQPTVVTYQEYIGHQNGTGKHTVIECGTNAGYRKHRRLKQDACDECREAHNQYEQERRAKARSAA